MGSFEIHTNIPLDFPTIWTGSIYKESNIRALFDSDEFVEKVISGEITGTVGFKKIKKIPSNFISHVVTDAFISDSKEIMFRIDTLNNKPGKKLEALLLKNPLTSPVPSIYIFSTITLLASLPFVTMEHVIYKPFPVTVRASTDHPSFIGLIGVGGYPF